MEAVEEIEKVTGLSVVRWRRPQSSIRECLNERYAGLNEKMVMGEDVPSVFPEIIREVEELQTLGPAFNELKEKVERIEKMVEKILSILENRRD